MNPQSENDEVQDIEAVFVEEAIVKEEDLVHDMVNLDDNAFMGLLNEPNDDTNLLNGSNNENETDLLNESCEKDDNEAAVIFMIDSDDDLPQPFASTDHVLVKRENDKFSDKIPFNVSVRKIYFSVVRF